jgi:bleomycin hydrolase
MFPPPLAPAVLDAATLASLATATGDAAANVAHNAVTRVGADEAALDRRRLVALEPSFSVQLDSWKATNQRSSGRCWMFAALNLLRARAVKRINRKDFEFSQVYLQFWDKLERANYVLDALARMATAPIDDRHLAFLLDRGMEDGGQWHMFAALVAKYGLVPLQAMPETYSSSNTRRLNTILRTLVRRAAVAMRAAAASGANGAAAAAIAAVRERTLRDVYRVLSIDFGTPPETFLWQWQDDERAFHRDGELTPREFAAVYVEVPIDEYVCVVDDPRAAHPVDQTYTVELLGNVVGAPQVKFLNVDMASLKGLALQALQDGEPVWFGCDSGKHLQRAAGVWDHQLYDYSGLYGVAIDMSKAERLDYHQSSMKHAMLLTGVDVVDGKPRRWRCENSWGEDAGKQGFFTLSDAWFSEYVFEIAVHRDRLPEPLRVAYATEPVVLPAWDPMGSLAN